MDNTSSIERKETRQILVGDVPVGGNAPITVQSMTTTKTSDVDATLQQIYSLAAAGADIVRCTCNDYEAAEGLAQIVPRSPVPIVADVHNQYKMALAAIASGVDCLRLNPGNIRKPAHIKAVAEAAGEQSVPIRIGVNGGSLHPELYERYGGKVTPEAMVESALTELNYFDEVGFDSKSNKVLIRIDPKCFRPTEVDLLLGDSSKAKKILNWEPKISFDELVNEMCETDNQLCKKNN